MRPGRKKNIQKITKAELQDICQKILDLDLITTKKTLTVTLWGVEITLNEEDIRDLTLIIYNAYERRHGENRMSLCREAVIKAKLSNLLEYSINRTVTDKLKPHQIAHLVRMYHQLHNINIRNLEPDYRAIRSIAAELKPDITEREFIFPHYKIFTKDRTRKT